MCSPASSWWQTVDALKRTVTTGQYAYRWVVRGLSMVWPSMLWRHRESLGCHGMRAIVAGHAGAFLLWDFRSSPVAVLAGHRVDPIWPWWRHDFLLWVLRSLVHGRVGQWPVTPGQSYCGSLAICRTPGRSGHALAAVVGTSTGRRSLGERIGQLVRGVDPRRRCCSGGQFNNAINRLPRAGHQARAARQDKPANRTPLDIVFCLVFFSAYRY